MNQINKINLQPKFCSLILELKAAKLYFSFFQKLMEAKKGKDLLDSYGFWNHTITSYALSTFVCLCRVYDDYKKRPQAFHLSRFVKDIETIRGGKFKEKTERAKLNADLNFLNNDQKVKRLREWRNKVVCHREQDLLLGGKHNFFVEYGLDEREIHELIERGFLILQNWASIYESDYAKWIGEINRANAQEERDIPVVLAALRLSREKQNHS